MAFAVTAGSGTTVSADVYGTAHNVSSGEQTQFVALASGTLGALALATATNPTFFQPTDATNLIKSGSATNLAAYSSVNAQLGVIPGQWSITHAPGAAAQATITKAAGAAGIRHVCTGLVCTLTAGTSAPTAALVTFNLRDGATGAGTILATFTVGVEATAGRTSAPVCLSGLNIVGTAATAMTLETSAATGANVAASVSLMGYETV